MSMNPINQILAGLLTLAITLITAATVVPEGAWNDPYTLWQFGALAVSSIAAVFLPIAKGGWAGALKTGSAAILAGIGALLPLINGVFGVTQWLLVILAVLNAVAVELGVYARVASAKGILADPQTSDTVATKVDPTGTVAAEREIAHVR
jgi:hypothetical protein